jgi:beta-N-acetylhexosaminidase
LNKSDARLLVGRILACRLPADIGRLDLDRFPVANYIVFKDALGATFEASMARIQAAKAALKARGIEPLFMMDEEGGRVTQVSDFFPPAPSSAAVARILKPGAARDLYAHMSEALAHLGIDVNLAPCVDVNTEPMNPIIGTRSFGDTVEAVDRYAGAFVEASKPFVGCIAKHFPGHGMTTVDSHLDLPLVSSPGRDLEAIHVPPFAAMMRAGIDGFMVSHCCYTALQQDGLPASLSRQVVNDLLRRQLGFDGLVVTDSLDMDAVTRSMGPREVARHAFNAGADMLLYTENSQRFEEAFGAMLSDVLEERISIGRLDQSIARRRTLLNRPATRPSPAGTPSHDRYLEVRNRVLSASVRVHDPKALLPLSPASLACVATNPKWLKNFGPRLAGLEEIKGADQAMDRVLLLWLLEPLRLPHSLEMMRGMIAASRLSVLVTSYRSMADMLSICDVRVVTDDTTPETQLAILHRLFGENLAGGGS